MKSWQEIESIGLDVCEFSGECESCETPKGRSFVFGYSSDQTGESFGGYICQHCATEYFEKIKNNQL